MCHNLIEGNNKSIGDKQMPTNHRRDHDAASSNRAFEKYVQGLARGLMNIDMYHQDIQEGRPTLTKIIIKCDPDDEQGVLIIGSGYEGGTWKVCFHRDVDIPATVTGFGNRLRNGSLKWKDDDYANKK